MVSRWKLLAFGSALALAMAGMPVTASALDLSAALANAYRVNPNLNAQRANTRGVDEGVPTAKSAGRPTINATGDAGATRVTSATPLLGGSTRRDEVNLLPRGVGIAVNQQIYRGGRIENGIRAAESNVLGAREVLRNTEQNTLLDAVTAYMNVVRDTAIVDVRQSNVNVLSELVRQTRDRFNVGEVTRTDVAQAEARVAGARSELALSQSNLRGSIARFKQVIGLDPKKLAPVRPVAAGRLPKSQGQAVNQALQEHPAVAAALHGVDSQLLQVKIVEGELYPTVAVGGSLTRRFDVGNPGDSRTTATVVGQVSIPIYEGGSTYSRTRAAKETLGERRLQVDSARDSVVAAVVAAWALFEATGFQIEGAEAQAAAAQIALNGVREEARVGQRTTLDVLNAEQELLSARLQQITAQRDRVVASYSLLSATGQLSARTLGLKVATYDPKVHYQQVKDSWLGLRTPSSE